MPTSADVPGCPEHIPAALAEGTVLDRYTVGKLLGAGGAAHVYQAYDCELDRDVALKVMRWGDDERLVARVLREARAMAQLSHTNVLPIYGIHHYFGSVFLTMELVESGTMTRWLQKPRSTKEIVDAFIDAGRGLSAAHRAGLVHRDFKPSNVLIARDGRAQVADFGLVRDGVPSRTEVNDDTPPAADDLTRTGTVMGTPAYMSPEQHAGLPVDEATDQYAFCVSLWQALFGKRPFLGSSAEALFRQKLAGPPPRPRPRGAGRRVPARLFAVVERGLAPRAEHRWPSMGDLIAALEDAIRPRRTNRLSTIMMIAAVCTGAAWMLASDAEGSVFADGRGSEVVFDPAVDPETARVHASVRERLERLQSLEDEGRYDEGLVLARDVVKRTRDERAAALHPAALRYLGSMLAGSGDAEAGAEILEQAFALAVEIGDDATAADASSRLVHAVGSTLQRGTEAEKWVRHAESLGRDLGPLWRAGLLTNVGWMRERQGRLEEAKDAFSEAREIYDTMGGSPIKRARTLDALGTISYWNGEYVEAADYHRRALAILEPVVGPLHVDSAHARANLGNALAALEHFEEGEESLTQALADHEAGYGTAHPTVAADHNSLAVLYERSGRYHEALSHHRAALSIYRSLHGNDHPDVALVLNNIGSAYYSMHEYDLAQRHLVQALAIWEATLGPRHHDIAMVHYNLGGISGDLGDHERAKAEYRLALDIWEELLGPQHPSVAGVVEAIGNECLRQDRPAEARPYYERALEIQQARMDGRHEAVGRILSGLGDIAWLEGDLEAASAYYEEALAIFDEQEREHAFVPFTRFNLAKLLWDQGHRSRSVTLARDALAEATRLGRYGDATRTEARQWLREHRTKRG
jgi:serine/threonine protein kinase/Tfp pilus assembly protein PilF